MIKSDSIASGVPLESARFRTMTAMVLALPPKPREALLFGRHPFAILFQKILARITGYSGPVCFDVGGGINCKFESFASEKYFWLREHFEQEEQDYIRRRIAPGMLVFDVGGNIGFMSLLFSSLGARVVTFEPSPVTVPRLERNLALNPHRPVAAVIRAGASDESGEARLTDCGTMSNISPEGRLKIQLVRLDDVAEKYGFPNFLKIDVEGHAGKVLAGAPRILEHAPSMMIEVHHLDEESAVFRVLSDRYSLMSLDGHDHYPKRLAADPSKGI